MTTEPTPDLVSIEEPIDTNPPDKKAEEELRLIKSCLLSLAFAIEDGRISGVVKEVQYTLGHNYRVRKLKHECCDGECNHDDCCGKVAENCPSHYKI